jgi:hypothetical protein
LRERRREKRAEEVGGLGASWREESYLGSMSAKRSPVKPHTPVLHFTESSGHASSERFVWGKKKREAHTEPASTNLLVWRKRFGGNNAIRFEKKRRH